MAAGKDNVYELNRKQRFQLSWKWELSWVDVGETIFCTFCRKIESKVGKMGSYCDVCLFVCAAVVKVMNR